MSNRFVNHSTVLKTAFLTNHKLLKVIVLPKMFERDRKREYLDMIRLRDLLLILLKAQKFDFKDMDVLCSIIELFTSKGCTRMTATIT